MTDTTTPAVEPETMSVTQRVRDLGLTVRVGAGKRVTAAEAEDGWEHDRYRYELTREGRKMTGVFRMGVGHAGSPPTLPMIFDALCSDSACVADGQTLGEFVADLGYEDVDKAQRTYEACKRQDRDLRALLGDHYEACLYNTERL